MKILYLHQYFTTPKGSGGVRSYEFARRWVQAGHKVHVVTGTAFDSSLPINSTVYIDGIQITSVGVPYKSDMSFYARLKSFGLYAFKSIKIAVRAHKYDIVLATSTPLTVAIPALAAKWFARRKVIFEVRDVWPDAAIEAGVLTNRFLIFCALILEKMAYSFFDHIVPLSSGMKQRIASKGISEKKMTMIPNCSDTSVFRPDIDGKSLRNKYHVKEKFIILYAGAVNLANDIEYLIEVANRLKKYNDIEFWVVGKGNRFQLLETEVKKLGVNNIRLHGLKPKQEIPFYAAAANVGIITFIPKPVYYENSPNKFFDYIAAGLPVIFNRSTWLEKYLVDYENGFVCKSYCPSSMVKRILELKNNPQKCKNMGRQSRKLANEVFSRDLMSLKYLKLLKSIYLSV